MKLYLSYNRDSNILSLWDSGDSFPEDEIQIILELTPEQERKIREIAKDIPYNTR